MLNIFSWTTFSIMTLSRQRPKVARTTCSRLVSGFRTADGALLLPLNKRCGHPLYWHCISSNVKNTVILRFGRHCPIMNKWLISGNAGVSLAKAVFNWYHLYSCLLSIVLVSVIATQALQCASHTDMLCNVLSLTSGEFWNKGS